MDENLRCKTVIKYYENQMDFDRDRNIMNALRYFVKGIKKDWFAIRVTYCCCHQKG